MVVFGDYGAVLGVWDEEIIVFSFGGGLRLMKIYVSRIGVIMMLLSRVIKHRREVFFSEKSMVLRV